MVQQTQTQTPKGKTAQYRRIEYEPDSTHMVVDVDMVLDGGRWYARLWNDDAVLDLEEFGYRGEPIPAGPWYLDLPSFCGRYEPVAPLPKLGDNKNG